MEEQCLLISLFSNTPEIRVECEEEKVKNRGLGYVYVCVCGRGGGHGIYAPREISWYEMGKGNRIEGS